MNMYEIRNKLKMPVFRMGDFCRTINKPKSTARIYLNRMVKKGLIHHLSRGYYSTTEDRFAVSSNVVDNSYLSFMSGLYLHGAITQVPSRLQLVSPKKFSLDFVDFVVFPKEKIFGYGRNNFVSLGTLEKIVVDCLYRPRYCNIHYLREAVERCDPEKTMEYAKRMNAATAKRAGYLLEQVGHEVKLKVGGVHKLNPTKRDNGKYNAKWGLYINEVF